ncbi:MAG TPA: methionyl-tRNA formyltransferase [Rhizomicrobium sp.]|nr:methionyl-tRNA formyltransferase [Rhizomicrobium sp.]
MKIVFMGTPEFAVPTLARLIAAGHEIAAVYSQPARPKGRGLASEDSPVAKLAKSHGLDVRTPVTLKDAEAQGLFAALKADIAVVVAYGLLLPKAVLDAPRLGCFNLHGSLLPRWRGAAPIQRAIMAGDEETGVMVMKMEEGLDTGPVLLTIRTPVLRKTTGDLQTELAQSGAELMAEALIALEQGPVELQPQIGEPTYAKKILKEETRIDWSKSAREIDCLIRGLSPVPGAWCEMRGERVKILCAEPVERRGDAGEMLDDELTIACGDGALRLTKLQRAGKSVMEAKDFLRGFPIPHGTRLS